MSGVSPPPSRFRPSLILSQPFFLVTAISQVIAWSLTFIAQCLAEARYHSSRNPDGSKPTGTPIGIGWFAIFFQPFIFYRVVGGVMQECEYQVREQLATLLALNIVLGLLCSHSAIYAQQQIAFTLYGYGWMVLATLNLLWLLYFTSSDQSRLVSLLNPGFKRKQLIRTSINLRRSGSYSNHLPNIAEAYPHHYDGAHEITLGEGRVGDASINPDNEKLLNEITSALLPSEYPQMSEGYHGHDPARISMNHSQKPMPSGGDPTAAQNNPSMSQNNVPSVKFQQDHQSKPFNYPHDPMPNSQLHSENVSQAWQRQYINQHMNGVEPSLNTYQQHVPSHHPDNFDSSGSTSSPSVSSPPGALLQPFTMPLIDRTLLNQAYRQEELRSATDSEVPDSPAKPAEPIVKAKALYAYKASITDPNEMSFEKGETLEITNHTGKWWRAKRVTGETGIVPSNYFQLLNQQQ